MPHGSQSAEARLYAAPHAVLRIALGEVVVRSRGLHHIGFLEQTHDFCILLVKAAS